MGDNDRLLVYEFEMSEEVGWGGLPADVYRSAASVSKQGSTTTYREASGDGRMAKEWDLEGVVGEEGHCWGACLWQQSWKL